MRETDVAIVGGGPAGLMLAIEVGARGIACVVFDENTKPPHLPKANATSSRTMEHFRAAAHAGMPLDVVRSDDAATRTLDGADAVIIRPDHHIGWRGEPTVDPAITLGRAIAPNPFGSTAPTATATAR